MIAGDYLICPAGFGSAYSGLRFSPSGVFPAGWEGQYLSPVKQAIPEASAGRSAAGTGVLQAVVSNRS